MRYSNASLQLNMGASFWWLLIVLSLFTPLAGANPAALTWLDAQLQGGGSYERPSDIATPVQATAETLRTLHVLDSVHTPRSASLAFLDASSGQPITEYLARTLIAHSEAGTPAGDMLVALEANQNPDGGFGGSPGMFSTVLDTAFALEALAKMSSSHTAVISAAVNYLRAQQNTDGSYTQNRYAQGARYITASALMALHVHRLRYDLAQPIGKAVNFLLSNQDANGGWGSDFETSWALLALIPATTDAAPLANAAKSLANMQLSDGSWGQDIYRTALAARALWLMQAGSGTLSPWEGAITGHVVDRNSGLPLGGVLVSSGNGQPVFTGADGGFLVQGIAPGSYSVGFTLAGYTEAGRTGSLNAGQQVDLGTVGMTASQDVGIVAGIVTAAANNQPLAGVSVTLSGSSNATTLTDAAGAYRLVVPPGSFEVIVSAPGFLDATATATLAVGSTLTLSPSLTDASGTQPSTTGLYGTVVDADTGQPLTGVDVAVSGGTLRTVSDAAGTFSLVNLAPGTWELDLNLIGYGGTHIMLTAPLGVSNLGIIRLPSLTGSTGDGIVTGSVTDAANGNPIAGAHITLSGATTVSAVTNALGAYRIAAPAGAITITASAPGFLNAIGSATLQAGATLTFSPSLPTESATVPTQTTLVGTVVDADTGLALAGVTVAVAGGSPSVVTDASGQFSLADLAPGAWMLDLNIVGYQGLRVSLTASAGVSDLGTIRLPPATTNGSTLTGIVTDNKTGTPLVGALVAIDSEGKSVHTAADGSYRIDSITQTRFTVAVSAVGYLSRQGEVSLTQPGLSTLNVALDRAAVADFDIDSVLLEQPGYPAHSKIKAQAHLVNGKALERKVRLYGVIVDAGGQIIEEFPARFIPLGGNGADALETVPANDAVSAEIDWHNGAATPGWYEFIVQAYDGASGQLLAERSVPVEILATRAIGGSVTFDPPIAQLAAQQPVHLTALVSNRGNLNLAEGTITAKVTLKNPGYQTSNTVVETQTLAQGNGLNRPLGIDRDNSGNLYAVNNSGGTLSRVDAAGTVTQVATGFASPVDVEVAPNGDVYVLNASSSYERLAVDGSRQKIVTSLSSQQAIEVLADGRIFIAASGSGVYSVTPTGSKTKLPLVGLSNALEIQSDSQGTLYIGDFAKGTIFRLAADNTLETVQTGLPSLETFAIAADGSIAAVYSSKKLAFFAPDGARREITNALPLTVRGNVWDTDGRIILSVDGAHSLIKLYPSTPSSGVGVGEVMHTSTVALPPLELGAAAIPLDFGSWVPTLSGDFQVELVVDTHSEYGSLFNTLHVGPNAHGDITVAQAAVRPGDNTNQATISLFGADSTSITRIDPAGTTLAAASKTTGRGIAADTKGNIYATNTSTASSIVKISPTGVVSTFVSGYSFGYGLAIDAQDNLYSYSSVAANAATVLKITPDGTVTPLATLGGAVKGLAIGPDGQLYVVDAANALSRIHPDGRVELVTKNGITGARGLTIDANGYFYILTVNMGLHLDEDGVKRNYYKILRVSSDGKRYSEYHNQAQFEFEGVNVTADCSNNLLFAPTADYPFKLNGEENRLLQVIGDTGEERQVLYGPDFDPALSDMDVLFYDRFGQRLLIWTDLNQGKIFSFPVVCGGIDADVHLITRGDVDVSGMSPAPNQSTDLGNGSFEHVWNLTQIDNRGVQLQLGLLLKGMSENETRAIAQDAFVEFHNSFVAGQKVRTPLTIPNVLASTAMQIQPALDGSQYGPQAPVGISVDVINSGALPFSGELQLGIVDAVGFPVQDLPPITVTEQVGLSTVSYPAQWNTSLFLTGDYRLQAKLLDASGAVVASGFTPFSIVYNPNTPTLTDSLNPDKLLYAGWDQVRLDGSVTNTAINALMTPTTMSVSVSAPDGTVIYTDSTAIAELAAGGSLPAGFAFPLADAVGGVYSIDVKVTRSEDGVILDSFQKTFTVVRTTLQGLIGSVTATPKPVDIGVPVTCSESVTNQSAVGIDALPLTSVLVNLDTETVISEEPRIVILAGKQSDPHDRIIDTSSLKPGDYACLLRATVDGVVKELANAAFRAVVPKITLSGTVFHDLDHNQAQTGNEPSTAAGGTWITALSQGVAVASASVQADGSYQLTVPGLADYTLVIADSANGAALPTGWSHTGEIAGGTADAAIDGRLDVTTSIRPIGALNFGIDGAPSEAANDAAVTTQGVAVLLPILANDWPGVGTTQLSAGSIDLNPATPAFDTEATLPGEGRFTALADGGIRFIPQPGFSGVSSLTYRVQDDLGQTTASAQIKVIVTGLANPLGDLSTDRPHANPDEGATPIDTAIALAVIGNDVAGPNARLEPASLDLDPSTATIETAKTDSAGLWQANADGTVTFMPNVGYSGLAQLTYAIADNLGNTATSTLSISVSGGQTPVALDDSGATWTGIPLALSILDNDHAGGGQTLSATGIDLYPDTPAVDSEWVNVTGHWQVQADGTVTYTPTTAFSGDASLNYTVTDSIGLSTAATIRIVVLPTQLPSALDDTASALFNTPLNLSPTANDRAEPGSVLNPATLDLDPATDTVEVAQSTPEGDWQVQPDGSLNYTPALNYVGDVAPLNYLIRDSLGRAATAQVRLSVAPPTSVTLSGQVFHDLDHNQIRNGSEPGANAGGLFISVINVNGLTVASAPVAADGSYQLEVPPLTAFNLLLSTQENGVVANLPSGWRFTGETQVGVVDSSADGRLNIQVGVVALSELNFAIDGDPSVANDDHMSTAHAVPLTLDILANDQPGPGATAFIPATLDLDPSTTELNSQISLAGQGVYIAQSNGSIVFTPDPVFSGVSQLSYRIQDDLGQAANAATVTVAVGPDAIDDSLNTAADTSVVASLAGNDLIPVGAVYAPATAASHGTATINADGGTTYSPVAGYSGADSFSYRVCLPAPNEALCDSAVVAVTIVAPTPVINLDGTLDVEAHGRLLVLVDPLDEACRQGDENTAHDSDDEGDDQKEDDNHGGKTRQPSQNRPRDSKHDQPEDSGDEHDENGHEDSEACLAQQSERDYLDHVLQTGAWTYTRVGNAEDYTQALHSGAYNLHALLSAKVKLDESVQKELREAVNHGVGLLVGGDADQRNNVLDSVLGLQYQGHIEAYGVRVAPAPGYDGVEQRFTEPHEVNRIRPQTASVLGQFIDARNKTASPALTHQHYGRGEAAYLGFDLPAEAALSETGGIGEFSRLLLNLLDDLSPAPAYRAGDVIGLRLNLANRGQKAIGWIDLALSNATVYDAGGAEPQADGSLRWLYQLGENERLEQLAWTRLSAIGPAAAQADIHAEGSTKAPYAVLTLDLPVTETPTLDEALFSLNNLVKSDRNYRNAQQSAQRAATALAKGKQDTVRSELLKTADALLKITGPKAAEVRQAIGEALRRLALPKDAVKP